MEPTKPKNDWKSRFFERLRKRYRLVFISEESLEERYSIKLTKLGIFVALGITSLLLITFTILLISATRLKEYIPGYSNDYSLKRKLFELAERVDSLENVEKEKDLLLFNIQNIISNKPIVNELPKLDSNKTDIDKSKLLPTENEKKFRADVEQNDRYNLTKGNRPGVSSNTYFYPPIKGKITTSFNPAIGHFGVDVVAGKDEAVKATLDGVVIFSGWTSDMGHVIQLQHTGNIVSIYKHNSALLKKEGQKVKAGEVIAITGSSGELSSDPHLHFEIWMEGQCIDPQSLMVF